MEALTKLNLKKNRKSKTNDEKTKKTSLALAKECEAFRSTYERQIRQFIEEQQRIGKNIEIDGSLLLDGFDRPSPQETPTDAQAPPPFGRFELNKAFPCLVNGLDIVEIPNYGRGVITSRSFNVGEIIAVGSPYAWAASNSLESPYCSTCANMNCALLPCPQCARAFFCSHKCQRTNRTHKFECGTTFHRTRRLKEGDKCAINVVLECIAAFDGNITEMRVQSMAIIDDPEARQQVPRVVTTAKERYFCMLRLAHFHEEICAESVERIYATMMGFDKIRQLFGNVEDQRFLWVLIGHCSTVIEANGFNIQNNEMGALYDVMSFFNHSCAPNVGIFLRGVRRHSFDSPNDCIQFLAILKLNYFALLLLGMKLVAFIARPVKPGDQLCISYGSKIAGKLTAEERRVDLEDNWGFKCMCWKCEANKPIIPETQWEADSKSLLELQHELQTNVPTEYTTEYGAMLDAYINKMADLFQMMGSYSACREE